IVTPIPEDPAAGLSPVTRRVPPPEGGPGSAPPVAEPGGKTPPLATPPPGEAPSSPQLRERLAAGTLVPGTGEADPGIHVHASPCRGRAPRAPVTAVPDEKPASGPAAVTGPASQTPAGASGHVSPPAGSSGAEWRKRVKAATSALHAEQRRQAG